MIWSIREEGYVGKTYLKVNCPGKTIFFTDNDTIQIVKKFIEEGKKLKKKCPDVDIMNYVEYCLEENGLI